MSYYEYQIIKIKFIIRAVVAMTEQISEPIDLDFVAQVLQPLLVVVWGEPAMAYLGVPVVQTVCGIQFVFSLFSHHILKSYSNASSSSSSQSYMLGVPDDLMDLAAKKLAGAGFERQNWSFSSTIDPSTRKDDEGYKRIQENLRPSYVNLDANSIRFQYADGEKCDGRVVLLRASYIHLSIPDSPTLSPIYNTSADAGPPQPEFYVCGNLYFPNVVRLPDSVIKVILEEAKAPEKDWQGTLCGWAISYLYGELTLRDDVLDGCEDERVKEWFNNVISRSTGGRSRTREKWGRDRELITNELIEYFQ